MKLAKKLEAEILKAYNTVWDAYLKGDMKTFASMLDEDCYIIGSAAGEVFDNKKAAVKYYKSTAEQITGKTEFRNRKIKVMSVERGFMVNEETDFYLLIDDQWTFYGPARVSSLFHKKNNKWKVIHQHGSFPDSKTEEGEQVNTDKIKAENIQLRDAVKRRTIELEEKNRELEIEAAVERVRAKALAMHRSEDIHAVVRTLRNELFGLNLEGVTAVTICLKQDDGRVRLWDITDLKDTGRYTWDVTFTMNEIDPRLWIRQIWSSKKKIIAFEQDSNDLKRTLKWLSQYDKKMADEITELIRVNKIKRGWHRAVKLASGRLITDFINEPPTEIESILLKMGAAFDLAYKRFLDLKNAEAQAREAQIETALERVRSKTMAMHKSEEVTGIAVSLNEELLKLGFEGGSTIIIIDKETGDTEQWTGFSEDKTLQSCYVPYFKHPYHNALLDTWKRGEKFLVYTVTGKEKKTLDEHYFTTGYKDFPESDKKWMRQMKSVTFSHAFMKYGAIHWGPGHLTEEPLKILQRFSKVFEQSYTRFLDLQKAEAQAREAKIEAALERVRSQSMAMHKSNDLLEVIKVVTEQLIGLDLKFDHANFSKITSDGSWDMWISTQKHSYPAQVHVPYIDLKIFNDLNEVIAKGTDFFSEVYSNEEKNKFFKHFFENTIAKSTPEERIQYVLNANGFARSVFLTKNIWFSVGNYRTSIFTDEENAIFKRFANVFEQAYTRFLDLQKAEGQAREAKIEAALERVRSRSMAMHKSDDLHEVIKVVIEQLSVLDLKFNVANFAKIDPDGSWDLWLSTPEQTYPALIHVPYLDHPIFNHIKEQITKKSDFYTDVYGQKETNIFFHHFFENTIAKNTPEERKQFVYSSKGFARSLFLTKNIWFSVGRYDATPFAEDENAIFKRFANVFEQAYTRFLDLQKAEAQAREADIELSLERVRAKTMAMQKPSEFVDVINEIGEQFVHLDFDIEWVNFGANGLEISKGIDIWNFAVIPGGPPVAARVFIPYFDHPLFNSAVEELDKYRRTGNDFFIMALNKDDKDRWLDHLFTKTIFKDVPEEYRTIQYAKPGYSTSNIALKDTWFSIGKFDPRSFTDEQHLILRRFAKAFGQAYTRFLDLQKAEAQAREAQVEAGLERVRSRAMAMQSSEQLRELIGTVFTELTKLDIVLTRCLIMIYDPKSNDSVWWMANSEAPTQPIGLKVQYHEHPTYLAYVSAWKQKELKWTYTLEGNTKKEWDDFLFVETELSHLPDFVIAGMKAPDRVYLNASFNSFGNLTLATLEPLSDEHFDIMLRFAKVFDLTYTRFNDLKQAEAQAGEARIETALERVRSRTMAMQKPDELADAAQILYREFATLNIKTFSCGYMFIDEEKHTQTAWVVLPDGTLLPDFIVFPLTGDHVLDNRYKDWKEKKPLHLYEIKGDVNKEHHKFLSNHVPPFVVKDIFSHVPDRIVFHCANFSSGYLLILATDYFSQEEQQTVIRFAKVFEMTYTRFLDLKQAEAQTREAQIELALERVRARTMAMHKSEELAETSQVLFHQLSELGGIPDRIAIGIADEANSVVNFWTTDQQGSHLDNSFSARLDERTTIAKTYQAWKEQKKSLVVDLHGEELKEWIQFARAEMGIAVKDDQIKDRRVHNLAFFSHGWILATSHEPQSGETIQILERFASVFNLTYRRFLDLEKAEAQAREAQIEAALERVRSSSLAMHKSDELKDVVKIVFENFRSLGLENIDSVNINIFHEDSRDFDLWLAAPGQDYTTNFRLPYLDHPIANDFFNSVKNGETSHKAIYDYDLKNKYFEYMFEYSDNKHLPEERKKLILSGRAYSVATGIAKHSSIFIHNYNGEKFSEETNGILVRFSKVFDQAYTRFLDLQKAEANAREAQIEAGLERVRAKAMAMHSSKDLAETLGVFYRELKSLSVIPIRCGVALMNKETRMAELTTMNTTGEGDSIEIIGKIKMAGHPVLDGVFESWLVQKEYHAVLKGNQIKEYYQVLKPQIDYLDYSHDEAQFGYYFMFNEGDVYAWTEKELTEDELTIYRRFTTVISLTYKRYKDLQQAEAQAREAKIEAGLERVRARTMAMHNSDDVGAATATMFTELEKLGIQNLRGGITIIKAGDKQEVWGVTNLPDGRTIRSIGEFDMHLHPLWRELLKAKLNKGDYNYYRLAGKDKEDYIGILNATPNYLSQPIKDFPDVHVQSYFFGEGAIWTNSLEPHSDEQMQTMKRFASVFSLTFRRYQDLKKAEAQAKEATIEAALERVRGKAMAMHSSKDLATTIGVFYHELEGLNLTPRRCGVGLINKETKMAEISTMNASADGEGIEMVGNLDLRSHPVLTGVYDNWLTKTEYHPVLRGNEIKEYYQIVRPQISFPDYPNDTVQYGYFFFFDEGGVYAWTEKELNEDELKIYRRFTSVLSLTYKRYKDLKDSEARTQAAIKDAALDRIRADIASMRTINDLDRITPLIWNELTVLGIPFIRCGVFIMDEEQELIHTFLSTPDGKAIAAFHLPYDTPGNISKVTDGWRHKKIYKDHWGEEEFTQFADILMKQGALNSREQYLKTIPHGGFYLHFLPFLQGMLYVGNTTQLKHEEVELIQHVADAFSTAYARYEDFNKLEAAKQQVEKTLTDLKQAQTQLVQSEKMASLGEMTAGIAHEIQNPLNFVNNFSEVSKELLDEMKTELETGNTEDAKGIADDVIQNLEKINHHGKRADAIVKSMLQHSRSSSGKKEPTDINSLADEYLRLAYHGLRAKDKSFNAKFETVFDDSIGKINIISQDIGRVLVNLINNAFYAVSERKKQESNGYEPTVEVLTKKTDDKIEIKVKDNGNGIPQKVLDKIFQPFFTTKPTGQGTGLGLSLSYDIIKTHGGEIKVTTKEGEGSEFIIQLPVNQTTR